MKHEKNAEARKSTMIALLVIPALVLLAMGCENSDDPADEDVSGAGISGEAADQAQAAMDDKRMGKRRHDRDGRQGKMGRDKTGHHQQGHCPSGKLLRIALEALDLTDEQRATLEGLRDSHKDGKGADRRGDHGDFQQVMIQALETGKVDRAAIEAKFASNDGTLEKKLEARNAKLATLHATLTPKQRQTLVDAVRAKLEAKTDKPGDKADFDRKGRKGKGKPGLHGKSMLKRWLRGIELTDEQQAQIDALTAKGEAQRPTKGDWADKREDKLAELNTLLDAFLADDFDPTRSAPAPKPMKDPAGKIATHVDQLEALIGILTAEQRAQLVEKIKSQPGKTGHGMKGMKGPGCGGFDCAAGDCPLDDDDQ